MSDMKCRSKRAVLWPALLSVFLGLTLRLPVCLADGVEVTLFGPKQYLRTIDKFALFDTFRGIAGQGKLIVQNGDENGNNRVKGALILLNGRLVFGPYSSDQQVDNLQVPIRLAHENAILVILIGDPGSYLTVQAAAEIKSDATSTQVIGIGGGTVSVQNHLGDTLTLDIPPLALPEDTSISISALPNPLPSPIANNIYPGAVLEPEGLRFSLPVGITVTLHDTSQNPKSVMLFWFQDSNHVLPLGNRTATQNSVAGQNFHFSTVFAGAPTPGELALNIAQILTGGPGMPSSAVDKIVALLSIAAFCQQLGYDAEDESALNAATTLMTEAAKAELSTPLPADPCGQNTLDNLRFSGELQLFGLDTLAQEIMARDCSFNVSPQYLFLDVGETWPQGITATLLDPNGEQSSCSVINWYSANLNVVDILPNGNFCVPTGVGPGIANVSANCDELLAWTQVTVCSLSGTWQGTYSGQRIACAERDSNGCCIEWGGLEELSGPLTATCSQTDTNVSCVIVGGGIELDFNGTNNGGKVTLEATTTAACGTTTALAEIDGTLSSDCSTFSGSFIIGKRRAIVGTFSLQPTGP